MEPRRALLLWMTTCCSVVLVEMGNVTEEATTDDTGSTMAWDLTEDECNVTSSLEWSNDMTLRVRWEGSLEVLSPVSVSVHRLCGSSCTSTVWNMTAKFRDRLLDIPVESNAVYYVDVSFECPDSDDNWTIPVPAGVPNLRVADKSNTSVLLTWDPFLDPLPDPWLYVVVGPDTNTSRTTNDTTSEVRGLHPYASYTFQVLAELDGDTWNVKTYYDWQDELTVRTDVGVPHAPTSLNTTSVGNTTVELTWEAPAISTGPVLQYRIRWKHSKEGSNERETGNNDTSMEVEGLDPYQWCTFAVVAETEAGPGQWSEDLEVRTKIGVPHAPTNLTTPSLGNTTVGLAWEAPAISTGPVLRYRVRWKHSKGGSNELETGSNDTSLEVNGLDPYERYTFAVVAETEAGLGQWSEELKVRTKIGVPYAPTALNTTSVGNTTVELTWEAPVISTGPVLRYRVRWNHSIGGSNERETGSNDTSMQVDGLYPYKWYTFSVVAETKAGPGQWSGELEVRTQVGVPHAPTSLTNTSVGNTTVGLTWEAPPISTGPVVRYRVRWKHSKGGSNERATGSNDTSLEVEGLDPYERYTFAVVAETEAGLGNWSEELKVQTKIGVPSVPRNFRIDRKTDVSFQISWSTPEFVRSSTVKYVVNWKLEEGSSQVGDFEKVISPDSTKDTLRHIVTDLLPYTNYTVRLSALNLAGRGPATEALQVQTDVGVPKPAIIRSVTVLRKRTVRVTWSTEGPYPGPVEFSLQAWRYPGPCSGKVSAVAEKEVKGNKNDWTSAEMTTVEGLTPFARYSFVVLLRTSATDGVKSENSDDVRMPAEAPGRPQHVEADCRWSPTKARVSWNPPIEPNGWIQSYEVRYGIVGESQMMSREIYLTDICSNQSLVISGMRPERRYLVTVTATAEGVSEKGEPGSPRNLCELPAGIPYLGNTSRLVTSSSAPYHVTLEWTGDTFSDYLGKIVRYSVLIGKEKSLGESTGGRNVEDPPTWSNFSSGSSDFYQATPSGWNPFGDGFDPLQCKNATIEEEGNRTLLRCTVGTQWPCPENETYCNGPLLPDTPYELKIRGFTRGGYNETQLLHARTGPIPKKSSAGTVAASVFSLLLLGAVAGGCYAMRRRGTLASIVGAARSKLRTDKENNAQNSESGQEMERSKNSRPIPIKQFSEHVRRMMSDSHLQFSKEFEELKIASPSLPCTVAESEENRSKNRWMNIFPFDHSRVKLLPLCDEPGSDFINASYIPGPSSPREYIASQGPLPHTLDDFWRMVWEQSVTTLVMLTQCTERGKKKCEAYWPEEGARHYGDLSVVTVSESMLATHVIRVMRLQLGSYDRQVKQIHFMHWPDFGCPDRPEHLIEFVGAVRDHLPRRNPGPILVHCSAGVGRTGTFIAVDRLMRQLMRGGCDDDEVDVYGTVLELRHHRTNMVQTEDQYIYIHLCVEQLIGARNRPPVSSAEVIYSNLEEVDTAF